MGTKRLEFQYSIIIVGVGQGLLVAVGAGSLGQELVTKHARKDGNGRRYVQVQQGYLGSDPACRVTCAGTVFLPSRVFPLLSYLRHPPRFQADYTPKGNLVNCNFSSLRYFPWRRTVLREKGILA